MSYGTCRDCRGDLVWACTESGARIALDEAEYPREDPSANVAWHRDLHGTIRARVLRADRPLLGYEHRAMPHAATCPALADRREQARARATASRAAREALERVEAEAELLLPLGDELAARRAARDSGRGGRR